MLLNANWAMFQLYHEDNMLHFNEMIMMMSTLYKINTLIAHRNTIQQVIMSLKMDTLFWYQANQSVVLLLNAAYLAGSNKYQFHSHWLDPTGLEPTIYCTWGEHANHYTTDSVISKKELFQNQSELYNKV